MKKKNVLTCIILTLFLFAGNVSVISAEGNSTSDIYKNNYSVGSSSTVTSGTIVLQGIYTDSTLKANDIIDFTPNFTVSGTLNNKYYFSIKVNDIADGCTVSKITADFDGTGIPAANSHNISLNGSGTSWGCSLSGNVSGGYVSAFTITIRHTCNYTSEITTPSTCSDNGFVSDVCACGHSVVKETLDLADHDYGDWEITKEAKPYSEGSRERVCSVCRTVEKETIPCTSGATVIDSGSGGTIQWTLYSDYHLRFTGTGYINSAPRVNGSYPWEKYKDLIKSISIEEEIVRPVSFDNYTSLESVEMCDTVDETLGFQNCTKLKNVKLSKSTNIIQTNCFNGCSSLESIVVPEGVTLIADNAFTDCSSLKEIVIPNTVTYMGKGAFMGCTQLSTITLSDEIEWIPMNAFWGCSSLSSIVIPENVNEIRDNAFRDCTSLTSVEFLGAAPNILGEDVFTGTDNSIVLYYDPDTPGWNDEKWNSYSIKERVGESTPEMDELRYQQVSVKLNSYYFAKNKSYDNPPEVTVKNYKGKILSEGIDYNVTYDAAPYTEGEHTIKVVGISPFNFNKTVTYKVLAADPLEWNSTASDGNVYFTKSEDGKTLTIFGFGPMRDIVDSAGYGNYYIPGYCYTVNGGKYMAGVETVLIDEGVETVGRLAFAQGYNGTYGWFPDVSTIYIPSSVSSIKEYALYPENTLEAVYIYSKDASIAQDSINAKNIYGYKGSTAYEYALAHSNISFHEICDNHKIQIINKVDAKCESEGYSGDYICSVCGETIKQGAKTDPLGHDYQSQEGTYIAATCTTDGKEADKKCERCGDLIEGEVIPASHDLLKHEVHDSTCYEAGNIEYYECTSCKKLFVKSETDGSMTEVTDDSISIPLSAHTWGAWSILSNPTCTKKGIRVRFCDKCDAEERAEIDVIDHEWNTYYTVDKVPTVSATGSKSIHCSVCDAIKEGSEVTINMLSSATESNIADPSKGTTTNVSGATLTVTSVATKTVEFTTASNTKTVTVPDSVMINGKQYTVTEIGANAFTGQKIRTITIGKNVKKIKKKAFKGSPATKLIVKTKKLTKKSVKGCLKGSKVKSIKVKVGSKKTNKKYVKKYKKIFTKKNAGKKVSVK